MLQLRSSRASQRQIHRVAVASALAIVISAPLLANCGGGDSQAASDSSISASAPASEADPSDDQTPTSGPVSTETTTPSDDSSDGESDELSTEATEASDSQAPPGTSEQTDSGEQSIPDDEPEGLFAPLIEPDEPGAVVTPSGVVTPVEEVWEEGFLVRTPCRTIRLVTDATPLFRAHVVLDPGHGGREVGAVGEELRETDVNLDVALRARDMLEALGATVVLTRDFDHTLTTVSYTHLTLPTTPYV